LTDSGVGGQALAMSKLSHVFHGLVVALALVSLGTGCAEQKGAKKDDKKADEKKADDKAADEKKAE
jgi:hypothetical protein